MSDDLLAPDAHKAARTYGAAADHYMLPALGFWERFGSATVSRVPLSAGQAVLDLCCGAGASALPAAVAVGPSGRVVGVDVAAPLYARLAHARRRRRYGTSSSAALTPDRPGCPANLLTQ